MGSPVSPIVADLFMEDFEDKALSSFHSPPRFWGRYVDDTMIVLKTCDIDNFTTHLNSVHPAIKFTVEREDNQCIAMLDALIRRDLDGSLSFSVYRKATHTDQYLNFNSHQPLEHKLGVIRTLKHRANVISSDHESLEQELHHVQQALSVCGYTKWAWNLTGSDKITPKPLAQRDTPTVGHISLPYIQGVTEALSRKIRKAGVTVHVRPINTLRNMLVSPKDKVSKPDRTCVVYDIQCEDCDSRYIGETERPLKRLKEHNRESSPVGSHMKTHSHQFKPEEVDILNTDSRWFQRGVKESIYIAAHNPDLNKDRGRHHLPAVYQPVILSCDSDVISKSHDQSPAQVNHS